MAAPLRFSQAEREVLLAVKGVGPGVVSRLEQIGVASLADLARRDAREICLEVSARLGTTCWRNSPKALAAVVGAIEAARARE
jgi:predicted flap endonuclease-1-like 5' DNA nuclease